MIVTSLWLPLQPLHQHIQTTPQTLETKVLESTSFVQLIYQKLPTPRHIMLKNKVRFDIEAKVTTKLGMNFSFIHLMISFQNIYWFVLGAEAVTLQLKLSPTEEMTLKLESPPEPSRKPSVLFIGALIKVNNFKKLTNL